MVRYRPDIVHIHSILPLFHALFGKLIGARTAVTFHGTDLYRVGNRKLFRWLVRSFDEVYYVSRAMEHLLNGCVSADRLHYTPNGVDLDRFAERLAGKTAAYDVISGERFELGTQLNVPGRGLRLLEIR